MANILFLKQGETQFLIPRSSVGFGLREVWASIKSRRVGASIAFLKDSFARQQSRCLRTIVFGKG
jgi:hypothetical protein